MLCPQKSNGGMARLPLDMPLLVWYSIEYAHKLLLSSSQNCILQFILPDIFQFAVTIVQYEKPNMMQKLLISLMI